MIVDAHAHIFPEIRGLVGAGPTRGLSYGRVAVGEEEIQAVPPLNERIMHSPEMLLAGMDWAGVDKAVLLQGPFYGECNRYVQDAVERHPDRLIGAAHFDPWGTARREEFEHILSRKGFKAVKLELSEPTGLCGIHPNLDMGAPSVAWLWDEMERRGLVLVLDLGAVGSLSYQTDAVRAVAEEHPGLRLVIAHLGQPTPAIEDDPTFRCKWMRQIDLGLLPNVWFDTASLPAYVSEEGYPYPTARRYLRRAIDRIGPHKVLWGTDVPGNLVHATYPQLLALARLHTGFLSSPEQELVLGGNAGKVYG